MIGDGELRDALAGLFLRITDRVGKATVVGLFAFVAEFQIPTLLVVWKGREGVAISKDELFGMLVNHLKTTYVELCVPGKLYLNLTRKESRAPFKCKFNVVAFRGKNYLFAPLGSLGT